MEHVDLAIIGGGIAGLSLAAEFAEQAGANAERTNRPPPTVVVLERENQLAYHTTGRSAATFLESYGGPEVRSLTRASRPILDAIGATTGTSLLRGRPLIWVVPQQRLGMLDELVDANPALRRVDITAAQTLCPVLRADYVAGAAVERTAQDIDVDGLFQHYRRRAIAAGVTIRTSVGVAAGASGPAGWLLTTDRGELTAARVVNAAGAWADAVAVRLGVPPAGLIPMRRTVAIASTDRVPPTWPLVSDVADRFYFRPESGGLLISPADETPSPPVDARAETEDVALALLRVNEATSLDLRRIRTSWAGLRTFAADRNPVVGFDPQAPPGYFWLAGQGGHGIQIAPALARVAAGMLLGDASTVPADLDLARIAPERPREPGPPPPHAG